MTATADISRLSDPSGGAGAMADQSKGAPLPVVLLLLLVIMVPIELSFRLGGLLLTPAKIYLVVITFVILPRLSQLKLRAFDWFIIAHCFWLVLTHLKTFRGGGIEGAGMYVLEILIVYLVCRVYLTSLEKLRATIGVLFLLVTISALLAVPEGLTGKRFIHDFARGLTGFFYPYNPEQRLGITRSASFFEHPILFGIFCSATLGLVWFTSSVAQRMWKIPLIFLGTFFSASSAPLLAFMLQLVLIGIERVSRKMKDRVKKLGITAAILGAILQFGTGRGFVGLIALIALNPATTYVRRSQWTFGIENVKRHPIFGFDPYTWSRPGWLAPSVDNNWLLMMMRAGFPGILLLLLGAIFIWRALAARGAEVPPLFDQMRKGWGIMVIAIAFTGATVAFFGKLQPLLYFYVGFGAALAAVWLPASSGEQDTAPAGTGKPGYTRFPPGHSRPARSVSAPIRSAPEIARATPAAPDYRRAGTPADRKS